MSNDYFTDSDYTAPTRLTLARAGKIAALVSALIAAFDKLPGVAYLKQNRVTYATATNGPSSYSVTSTYPITAYTEGFHARVKFTTMNSGPATISFDGVGSIAIKRPNGDDLEEGDLIGIVPLTYDGSVFKMQASITVATADTANIADDSVTSVKLASAFLKVLSTLSSTTANTFPYLGAGSVAALAAISAFGRSLVAAATAGDARTTLGLVIGTDVLAPNGSAASLTDIYGIDTTARDNIAVLAFKQADDDGDAFGMVDGYVDPFNDETDVDTATSTNENYDATGDLYEPGAWTTDAEYTPDSAVTGRSTYSMRVVIAAAELSETGHRLRFTFKAGAGTGFQIDAAYVYEQAASGDAYDGHATNKAQITFSGGSAGFTLTGGASIVSDEIDAAWFDNTKALVVTFDIYTGSANDDPASKAVVANWATYEKTGADEAATADVTGYSATDNAVGLTKVEVFDSADMVLQNNAYTADAAPDSARIVVDHTAVDTVTLNTDLTAEISRDGGTTWAAATLAQVLDIGSGRQVLAGSADLSAQPSGTSMKWRLKTFNDKTQYIHGVSLRWDS